MPPLSDPLFWCLPFCCLLQILGEQGESILDIAVPPLFMPSSISAWNGLFSRRLLLHLPHPVDTTNGRARFLSEQATLEVTLRMKRELDFINFA